MKLTNATFLLLAFCAAVGAGRAQEAPDLLLVNGRIVTVDDRFSVEEAVAVRGARIAAVGSDDALSALAGPATRIVDLGGRTVIPGLIDNHNHVVRATEYWPNEARLDGVTRRDEALDVLARKARELPSGEWLMTLGGWAPEQFVDDQADFTLEELDRASPGRPAFVQALYSHAYVNSAWLEAMGLPLEAPPGELEGLAADVVRDAHGRATGRLEGGFPMVERAMARFPSVPEARQLEAIRATLAELNAMGLTTIYDPGGVGVRDESYARFGAVRDADGGLTVRVFHTLSAGVPSTPSEAGALIEKLETSRPFQGDEWMDMIGMGELYYAPFHWDTPSAPTDPAPADMAEARRILAAAARTGWPVQTHATQPETIDHLLDLMEEINAEHPLRPLRRCCRRA